MTMPSTELVLTTGSQSVATRPTALTSPQNLSEIQILGLHPSSTESETVGVEPTILLGDSDVMKVENYQYRP